jgi:hypothetical protein
MHVVRRPLYVMDCIAALPHVVCCTAYALLSHRRAAAVQITIEQLRQWLTATDSLTYAAQRGARADMVDTKIHQSNFNKRYSSFQKYSMPLVGKPGLHNDHLTWENLRSLRGRLQV